MALLTLIAPGLRSAIGALLRACMLLVWLSSAAAQTVQQGVLEWQVKAAYLYKFGSYIEWPPAAFASQDSALKIGISGADTLADELLEIIAGRTINGRPVTVRKLRRDDPVTGFNILFIGKSNPSRLADMLAAVKGQPVLTVTESEDGLAVGSMINFVMIDGKLRFEVAPKAALLGNLAISARLLTVAYKVAGPS